MNFAFLNGVVAELDSSIEGPPTVQHDLVRMHEAHDGGVAIYLPQHVEVELLLLGGSVELLQPPGCVSLLLTRVLT